MSVRKIDLYVAFADVRVYPSEDFSVFVEKYHVFIDDEVAVVVGQSTAGVDYGLRVRMRLICVVVLLQLHYLLIFELINPDFLAIGL